MGGRKVASVGSEALEVVIGEDMLQRRQLVRRRFDFRELLGVLADDPDRLRVGEEVADVARRAGRVHGDPHRADLREREVEERPVEAVAREQRKAVALADAAGE